MPSTVRRPPWRRSVDQRRVDLAELHLGQRAFTSCSRVTGRDVTPAASRAFVGRRAARHLVGAQRDLEAGLGEVRQPGDLAGLPLGTAITSLLRTKVTGCRAVAGVGDGLHGRRAGRRRTRRPARPALIWVASVGAGREVERHLRARVRGLELLAERGERLGQRRGREARHDLPGRTLRAGPGGRRSAPPQPASRSRARRTPRPCDARATDASGTGATADTDISGPPGSRRRRWWT